MAMTLADLVEQVGAQYGYYFEGTASGGSKSTIEDTDLYEPDDFYIGMFAYITSAGGSAPEGEERPITDWSLDDNKITVSPDFTAAVASSDKFEILSERRTDIIRAVNNGIREARNHWLIRKSDTTTISAFADEDFDYDLPSDFVRMIDLLVRTDTDVGWESVQPRHYHITGTPGGPETLQLRPNAFRQLSDDHDEVMIYYTAQPTTMSTDTDTLGMGAPAERALAQFVIHWALYWLHDKAANRNPTGETYQAHYTQAEVHRQIAEELRATGRENPGGRWTSFEWPS